MARMSCVPPELFSEGHLTCPLRPCPWRCTLCCSLRVGALASPVPLLSALHLVCRVPHKNDQNGCFFADHPYVSLFRVPVCIPSMVVCPSIPPQKLDLKYVHLQLEIGRVCPWHCRCPPIRFLLMSPYFERWGFWGQLGVGSKPTEEEVKATYKKGVLRLHPSKNRNKATKTTQLFKGLNASYEAWLPRFIQDHSLFVHFHWSNPSCQEYLYFVLVDLLYQPLFALLDRGASSLRASPHPQSPIPCLVPLAPSPSSSCSFCPFPPVPFFSCILPLWLLLRCDWISGLVQVPLILPPCSLLQTQAPICSFQSYYHLSLVLHDALHFPALPLINIILSPTLIRYPLASTTSISFSCGGLLSSSTPPSPPCAAH